MGSSRATAVVAASFIVLLTTTATTTTAESSFKCSSPGATCNSLVGYASPNATTLSRIQALFAVPTLHSLLGANNLPLSTPSSLPVAAKQTLRIPFQCRCSGNGSGAPARRLPLYTVVKGDGLWHIAVEVFSGVVTVQQIQAANNISDPDLIRIGQQLWIPIPCSCDPVDGQRVIHYGHAVKSGSTLAEIARQYNTTERTLLSLNGLSSPRQLRADTPLDVPLKACTSMVGTTSLDYPFLVANGTYAFTAEDCVMCKCDAAKSNWTLQCEPSSSPRAVNSSSMWETCPATQCRSDGRKLFLGNATTSSSSSPSSCRNRTTCSYAGYTGQSILTALASNSTCPVAEKSNAQELSIRGREWSSLLVSIHLVVLCLTVVF